MLNKNQSSQDAMDVEATSLPALKLAVVPHHDVVGKDAVLVSTTQVCATIQAKELPPDESRRAPVDIVVALDVSSSMTGKKLELCKQTLELLLRQLLPHDRFGLVSFADDAVIEISARKLSEKSKNAALEKIKSLKVRGCTNISAAIGLAAQEMGSIESPNDVRSIFLLTDGLANRGISHAAGIVDLTRGCLVETKDDGTPPITIHCFGYGADHDDKLLTDVSEATLGGSYYFVDDAGDSNVASAFGDALGGILSVVAQNSVVNIHVPPEAAALGVEIADVYHQHKVQREDGSFAVTVGDFYAEESRDVLFDIKLATPSSVTLTPIHHVSVSLSYMDTLKKQLIATNPVVCAIARPPGIEVAKPNRHTALQWLRVYAAKEIAEADKMSSRGDLVGARTKIRQCKEYILSQEGLQSEPLVFQLITDLDNTMGGLSSHQEYATRGSKLFKVARQSHTMQRCSEASPYTPNVYRSARKTAMSEYFNTPK